MESKGLAQKQVTFGEDEIVKESRIRRNNKAKEIKRRRITDYDGAVYRGLRPANLNFFNCYY